MKSISSDKRVRRLVIDASLLCAALLLSFIEAVLPSFALPIPGFKPGFANIAVLFAAFAVSLPDAAVIAAARCIMSFLFFGSPTALIFSMTGALCVIAVLFIIKRTGIYRTASFLGISVISALAHNFGQLSAAAMLTGTAVFGYFPALIAASLIYGTLTGAVLCALPGSVYLLYNKFNGGTG